jgi:hypothetical protein
MPIYLIGAAIVLRSWCRRRTVLRAATNDDRRVGAGADEPLGETLPGDQLGIIRINRVKESNDLCREPSIVPELLRLMQFSADEVGNLALGWRSRRWSRRRRCCCCWSWCRRRCRSCARLPRIPSSALRIQVGGFRRYDQSKSYTSTSATPMVLFTPRTIAV